MRTYTQCLLGLLLSVCGANAQEVHGVTEKEIKIGQTMPYSGPGSHYSTIARANEAYFRMVNENGGVNGRKITLISLDDAYSPPKTVEQTRRLVEQEDVLLIFDTLGTATNAAIQKYLNIKKVPHLFPTSGATRFADPEQFPWTMGWQPNYQLEGHAFATYLLNNRPNAKIAVLYQKDDLGKDYIKGLRDRLGDKADAMIVKELSYNISDPTIDSQVVTLQSSGADVFMNFSTAKFAAQAMRKAHELGWKPMQMLATVSASAAVLRQVGTDASSGVLALHYLKDPADPKLADDPALKEWLGWMKKYYPSGDVTDEFNVLGYSNAQTLVQVLKQCGNDLSRENIMKQAQNLDMQLPMVLPGIRLKTGANDYAPMKDLQMARFNGEGWDLVGPVISGK
ncbi:ABC transporter substrate-binding protein [Bradyrhizobium sp.]|uniref:ABC transporter substrate-binding protein n=1 Tax=Bradyrhizobium sp. TaxID=376 RepID=UPI00076A867B|nr:ABC transporter substrate-binding protein [Bradyrhizobium sp. CCH5-F6]